MSGIISLSAIRRAYFQGKGGVISMGALTRDFTVFDLEYTLIRVGSTTRSL